MPLFTNKFTPKKTPVRKATSPYNDTERAMDDMSTDGECIVLRLGNNETVFKKGHWSFESGIVGTVQKENDKLRKQIEKLEEERNMLLLKFEVLLNLCTQTTAESHLKDREIASLKRNIPTEST